MAQNRIAKQGDCKRTIALPLPFERRKEHTSSFPIHLNNLIKIVPVPAKFFGKAVSAKIPRIALVDQLAVRANVYRVDLFFATVAVHFSINLTL